MTRPNYGPYCELFFFLDIDPNNCTRWKHYGGGTIEDAYGIRWLRNGLERKTGATKAKDIRMRWTKGCCDECEALRRTQAPNKREYPSEQRKEPRYQRGSVFRHIWVFIPELGLSFSKTQVRGRSPTGCKLESGPDCSEKHNKCFFNHHCHPIVAILAHFYAQLAHP